eukprot:XP_008646627.1 skin secretory protein xP2-like [Zea mays]
MMVQIVEHHDLSPEGFLMEEEATSSMPRGSNRPAPGVAVGHACVDIQGSVEGCSWWGVVCSQGVATQPSKFHGLVRGHESCRGSCMALDTAEQSYPDRWLLAMLSRARTSCFATPKATPPPPDTRPTDGSSSQQPGSAEGGAGGPLPAAAKTAPPTSHALAGDPAAVAPASGGNVSVEKVPAGGSAPTPTTGGATEGVSSSIPLPAPEEMEVVFGRRLRNERPVSTMQPASPLLPRPSGAA